MKIAESLACAPVIVLALAAADSSPAAPLKKPELDSLAATFEASPPSDFAAFLATAAKTNAALGASVAAHVGRRSMEHTKLPEYNIVLDSKYPAVVAKKGGGPYCTFSDAGR